MKSILSLFAAGALVLGFFSTVSAQTRSFGAGSLTLDDGSGHTSILEASGTTGTYILPTGGGTLVTSTSPGSLPLGGIIMWSGSIGSIPAGWALCDGGTHNSVLTPDLRNRFIVGAGNTYAVAGTGGSTQAPYTASGVISTASNTTGISVNSNTTGMSLEFFSPIGLQGDDFSFSLTGGLCTCGDSWSATTYPSVSIANGLSDPGHSHSVNDPGHTHTFNASGITLSTPSSLPPYYALAYIMRVQ